MCIGDASAVDLICFDRLIVVSGDGVGEVRQVKPGRGAEIDHDIGRAIRSPEGMAAIWCSANASGPTVGMFMEQLGNACPGDIAVPSF